MIRKMWEMRLVNKVLNDVGFVNFEDRGQIENTVWNSEEEFKQIKNK